MEIITATTNMHKIEEIKNKFSSHKNIYFLSMNTLGNIPEIIEDGNTFEENAIIKAKAVAKYTDSYVLADDSGLVVDSLNSEPGIYSARYGGLKSDVERYRLVLSKMTGIPYEQRSAEFVCVMALSDPQGKINVMKGVCRGIITSEPKGQNGFGYDPIFIPDGYEKTMAEINIDEKNKISHRSIALDNLYTYIIKNNLMEKS